MVLRLNSSPLLNVPFPLSLSGFSLDPPKKNAESIAFCPVLSLIAIIRKVYPADSSSWSMTSDMMRSALRSQALLEYICDSIRVIRWRAMVSFPQAGWGRPAWVIFLPPFKEGSQVLTQKAPSKMWGSFVPKSLVNELVIADWVVYVPSEHLNMVGLSQR